MADPVEPPRLLPTTDPPAAPKPPPTAASVRLRLGAAIALPAAPPTPAPIAAPVLPPTGHRQRCPTPHQDHRLPRHLHYLPPAPPERPAIQKQSQAPSIAEHSGFRFFAVGFRVHGTPRILPGYGRFELLLRETFIKKKPGIKPGSFQIRIRISGACDHWPGCCLRRRPMHRPGLHRWWHRTCRQGYCRSPNHRPRRHRHRWQRWCDGLFGGNCAARRTSDTRTNRSASAAAHLLADHITQCAAQAAAQRGSAVASHCTLSNQKPQNQSGQC